MKKNNSISLFFLYKMFYLNTLYSIPEFKFYEETILNDLHFIVCIFLVHRLQKKQYKCFWQRNQTGSCSIILSFHYYNTQK